MSAFTDAINHNWPTAELVPGCDDDCESGFSWAECDGCSSTLGGDRHPAVAMLDGKVIAEDLGICVDCLMYVANGDEPEEWHASSRAREEANEAKAWHESRQVTP